MIFESPGVILFQLGPITVRFYAVAIVLGFFVALTLSMRRAKQWELDTEELFNTGYWGFAGGIVGARLYYVALNLKAFLAQPWLIPAIWTGGMSIHGGILGGILAGFIYCKIRKIPFLNFADVLISTLPLAQAIGRWGNFFNSEAFGKPVSGDFPLKLFIPQERRPWEFKDQMYFQPTFLYESIFDLLLFFILYYGLAERFRKFPGVLACLYIAGYSIGRLIIEPMRTDSLLAFGIPAAILTSSVLLIFSLALSALLFKVGSSKLKSKVIDSAQ